MRQLKRAGWYHCTTIKSDEKPAVLLLSFIIVDIEPSLFIVVPRDDARFSVPANESSVVPIQYLVHEPFVIT